MIGVGAGSSGDGGAGEGSAAGGMLECGSDMLSQGVIQHPQIPGLVL